jgi:hypothetical protein
MLGLEITWAAVEKVDFRAVTDAARAKDVLEWPKHICFVVDEDKRRYGCDLDVAWNCFVSVSG